MTIRVNFSQNPKILARLEEGRPFHKNPELLLKSEKLFPFIKHARKPQAFKPGDEWHPFET
jgi:hypothetical protein